MEILKLVLLILAYSLGIATLIVQVICYMKDLEYKETIVFTIIFLLLITATTIQVIFKTENTSFLNVQELAINLLTVAFSVSIPINIHKERVDNNRKIRNRSVIIIGAIAAFFIFAFWSKNQSLTMLLVVSLHLFMSVVYSMFFLLFTKPGKLIQVREKSERLIAVLVLSIMTITLILFVLNTEIDSVKHMQQNGGFVFAVICIILSVSKIHSDMKKLIHHEAAVSTDVNRITNLGLTQREQEVALQLVLGKTYKEIAAELFVSLPTVKTHVSNIYSKANVRNRLELSNLIKL